MQQFRMITETVRDQIEIKTEQTSKGRNLFIEGPFLMSNAKNRNGRIYPKSVLEQAVDRYIKEYINERRAIGEFNHPDYPMPNPKLAAIKIESLEWRGDNVYGRAKVLNTPDGLIIKELLENDFKLGVSSRGLGSATKQNGADVIQQFLLNAIDAVDLPSGQICYVDAVNESVSWVERNGLWFKEEDRLIVEQANSPIQLELLEHLGVLFKSMVKK